MKYIDAEKLKYEIERHKLSNYYTDTDDYEAELFEIIDSLQQEQDLAEAVQSKSPLSVAYANRCFENGKQAMKEQMLKDAVEGEIVQDVFSRELRCKTKDLRDCKFKFGDKVKIIIIKEE